jgi:6,7-dimethyl-8-ribityllumazine synthase
MSNIVPPRPRSASVRRTFAIVASQFNAEYVGGLVDHASSELRAIAPHSSVAVTEVPGAFEIPVVIRELALRKKADAIIAIAVILKGSTPHAEHLARSVTDALQHIAIEHGVPVINAVLSLENETQARERCLEDRINRGTEAARAALGIAAVMADLRS